MTVSPVQSPLRTGRRPSRRRLFIALSLLLPIVLLGAAEGVLRLAGFGGYATTFRRVGGLEDGSSLVLADNPGPSSYFFANRSKAGSLSQSALVMPKPAGTFRVMLVGESAAKGFPQPRSLACSAFLRAMLSDIWPGRAVEVINLGTTAIASYPALGILSEALDYEPDLVVVYVGNNEFYGAYGVASLHSAGRHPLMIRAIRGFRSLAIAQFTDSRLGVADATERKTLMEAMVGQSFIDASSPLRAGAARNLATFVGDMIERCRARGVPIVVCTPPANERDLAPLGSYDSSRTDPGAAETVRSLLSAGAAMVEADPGAAESSIRQALGIIPEHATAHYLLGRALTAQGRADDAAASFRRAIDLDPMPWRPPSASVAALRGAVARRGAILCDLEAAFREGSPGGSVGWELMDDHVHPSLRGQDLVARTIVRAMSGLPGDGAVSSSAVDGLPDWRTYAARLGENPYTAYGVAHTVRVLGSIPFYRQTNPQVFERTDAFCRRLEQSEPPEVREQLVQWQSPETHKGEQRPLAGMVGMAMIRLGRPADAAPLLRSAAADVSLYSSWNIEFTYYNLACRLAVHGALDGDDRATALAAVQRGQFLLSQGRSTTGQAERYVGRLLQLCGEHARALPFLLTARPKMSGSDLVAIDQALVEAYLQSGQPANARAVIDNGIRNSGSYAESYRRMLRQLGEQ